MKDIEKDGNDVTEEGHGEGNAVGDSAAVAKDPMEEIVDC